jgi:DNA ligase-associated metallophosphoesterase
MLTFEWGDEPLVLLPQRAVLLARHDALVVADAHLGKAATFRRLGVAVPRGTTSQTLAAIGDLVDRHAVRSVVFLGDFLHSVHAQDAVSTQAALARWRAERRGLQLTLVRGNHDERAGDPPAALGIDSVDEPLEIGMLALCHHPETLPNRDVLAGHWHPCVRVGGRAHDRLRLPCFWFSGRVGVLPAFGAFTGMHPIRRGPGDRVFAVADDQVRELPTA